MQASTEQVNGAQMAVDYARNNPPANGARRMLRLRAPLSNLLILLSIWRW